MRVLKTLLIAALVCTAQMVFAQDSENVKTVYLTNGSMVSGIVKQSPDSPFISIRTADGRELSYMKSEVREIGAANSAKMPEKGQNAPVEGFYTDYSAADQGFWFAVENVVGQSLRVDKPNYGFEELNAVVGYRFSQYLRVGFGAGMRWYWRNDKVRAREMSWSAPLFINVRGSFYTRAERSMVPFYSFDIGGAIQDGIMLRPAIGLRFGGIRHSFTLALSYTGQSTPTWQVKDDGTLKRESSWISFVSLKLGYEF